MARKTLSCCIVVRNEQKNIKECLSRIDILADEIVIVDTGSTDKTCEIIALWVKQKRAEKNVKLIRAGNHFHDEDGDFDFGKAKTFAFSRATKDFVMWLDASDKIRRQKAMKKAFIKETNANPNIYIALPTALSKSFAFNRIRIGPRAHARMVGMIHETMTFNTKLTRLFFPIPIINFKKGRDLKRNLRILKKEWEREKSARTCFYIGNTHKELNQNEEALEWFRKRAYDDEFKGEFKEEHFKSLECIAEIVAKVKKSDTVTISDLHDVSQEMIKAEPNRMEGYYYLARYYMEKSEWKKAIIELNKYGKCKRPKTYKLWLNKHIYQGKAIPNAIEKCKTAIKYGEVLVPEQILDYGTKSTFKGGNAQYS